jgi:hypothetical protein
VTIRERACDPHALFQLPFIRLIGLAAGTPRATSISTKCAYGGMYWALF